MRRQRSPSPSSSSSSFDSNNKNSIFSNLTSSSSSLSPFNSAESTTTVSSFNQQHQAKLSCSPPSTRINAAATTATTTTTAAAAVTRTSKMSSSSALLLHPINEMSETFSNPRFLAEGGYGRVVAAIDKRHHNNNPTSTTMMNKKNTVAIKIMNFTCSTEDSKRLQGLSAFGDLAKLLPGQDYIPSHIASELRAHDALRDVKGTMPLLRVETFCDTSTISTKRNLVYDYDEEVVECFVMLVLPLLTPLNTRSFRNAPHLQLMNTVKGLSRALRDMHSRGWLHRDLSVTNTFTSSSFSTSTNTEEAEEEIFIGDFGLAVCSNGRCSTASKFFAMETNFCTTIWYRSPEIVFNPDLLYTFSNDCWSLGAVIAELIFCRPLFPGMDRDSQVEEMKANLGMNGDKAEEFYSSLQFPCDDSKKLFKKVSEHLLNFDPTKRSVQKFLDSLEKRK